MLRLRGWLILACLVHAAVFMAGGGRAPDAAAGVDIQPGFSALAVTFRPAAAADAAPAAAELPAEPPPLPETPRIEPAEPLPAAAAPAPAPAGTPAAAPGVAAAEPGGDAGAPSAVAVGGQAPPVYPRQSRMRGEEGMVALMLTVSAGGRCTGLDLVSTSGFERLDQAAMAWARGARFEPARRDGKPVEARLRLRVPFELRRKGTP